MSLRADNGFRIPQAALFAGLPALADGVSEAWVSYWYRDVADRCARSRFETEFALLAHPVSAASERPLWREVCDRPEPKALVPLAIALWPEPASGHWLALISSDSRAVVKRATSILDATSWCYWDNTDARPDGVGVDEWSLRRESWRSIPVTDPALVWTYPRWRATPSPIDPGRLAAEVFDLAGGRLGLGTPRDARTMLESPRDTPLSDERRLVVDTIQREISTELGPCPGIDGPWVQWLTERDQIIRRTLPAWAS